MPNILRILYLDINYLFYNKGFSADKNKIYNYQKKKKPKTF